MLYGRAIINLWRNPLKKIRVVTATSLFDGHDASINIFRRLFQKQGFEVIHLGHNRSVLEVVDTAIEEDANAILVSSYQGGHNEYYTYVIDLLKEKKAEHILVFGGGGGVILPTEIKKLEAYGVARIYHADIGRQLGIHGIVDEIQQQITKKVALKNEIDDLRFIDIDSLNTGSVKKISKLISFSENYGDNPAFIECKKHIKVKSESQKQSLVLGITGTGGSGKSSITDELVNRFIKVSPDIHVAVLAVDPSKSATGGALLGDRIRMNSIYHDRVYMRSFATRDSSSELSAALEDAISILKAAAFDLIIVETSGIGQGDNLVTKISDYSLYVMTSEFGAPSQLDKIDMLDLADFIIVNKCRKPGSEDALREVIIRYIRNKELKFSKTSNRSLFALDLPILATEASEFNNPGINILFKGILDKIKDEHKAFTIDRTILNILPTAGHKDFNLIQEDSTHYLADIASTVDKYHALSAKNVTLADQCYALQKTVEMIESEADHYSTETLPTLKVILQNKIDQLDKKAKQFLDNWTECKNQYQQDKITYTVRNREVTVDTRLETISGSLIPKVALPPYQAWGELLRFYYKENLPGFFPFTAGVFPFKRTFEDPKRLFAGEGTPEQTNKRFHYLTEEETVHRLSVAFDGVSLYGENPSPSPDIFGKVGESGVSICSIENMKTLFKDFDLTAPTTSVSMTINGPAPIMLAIYFKAAVAQVEEKQGKKLDKQEQIEVFRKLRGTVQADILKEDQGQNTCIFSLDFALKMMGDVQSYFTRNQIKNYYTISISGYHIAEAGANPITQLAFTLANGFHYIEHYRNLGLKVDEFAENFSFFFSNGMEPEYSVIGRVARRIWAIVMKELYGADEKVQKLKYHIQTSGRSLHAQEIDFNDIRTTLQALMAFYDNCNSLHTNSYDEAVTTPTEASVRRSMAIQLILSKEYGLMKNENQNQGSYIIDELTDLVETAVLQEFRRLSHRGGVLGAMEKQYQRSKIQEESLFYEEMKHSGEIPIIGVNTFLPKAHQKSHFENMKVQRATPTDKQKQLDNLLEFEAINKENAEKAMIALRQVALKNGNIFEELLNTVQYVSLGRITNLLYEIGGKYRRNM